MAASHCASAEMKLISAVRRLILNRPLPIRRLSPTPALTTIRSKCPKSAANSSNTLNIVVAALQTGSDFNCPLCPPFPTQEQHETIQNCFLTLFLLLHKIQPDHYQPCIFNIYSSWYYSDYWSWEILIMKGRHNNAVLISCTSSLACLCSPLVSQGKQG